MSMLEDRQTQAGEARLREVVETAAMDPTIRSVDALGTVLSVWAHPDDEAYLAAGIMTLAVDNGQRVVCVTATKGEAGAPNLYTSDEMALIRTRELRACLDELGVREHRWLDYMDGECAHADVDRAADQLAAIIDEVRPDTILTFGRDGFTDHPDHQAISVWVDEAHRRAAARGIGGRVHQVTQTDAWFDDWAAPWWEVGAFPPHLPPRVPAHELSIEIDLPMAVRERKVRALMCQESQTTGVREALGDATYRDSLGVERYRLA